jgi:hypothetical protein
MAASTTGNGVLQFVDQLVDRDQLARVRVIFLTDLHGPNRGQFTADHANAFGFSWDRDGGSRGVASRLSALA